MKITLPRICRGAGVGGLASRRGKRDHDHFEDQTDRGDGPCLDEDAASAGCIDALSARSKKCRHARAQHSAAVIAP